MSAIDHGEDGRDRDRWSIRAAQRVGPLACLMIFASIGIILTLAVHIQQVAQIGIPITIANAAVLVALLRFPTINRHAALVGAGCGFVVAYFVTGASATLAVVRPAANLVEIGIALIAVERWRNRSIALHSPQNLVILFLLAGTVAPIAAASLGAAAIAFSDDQPWLPLAQEWFAADGLGMVIAGSLLLVVGTDDWVRILHSRRRIEIVPVAIFVAGVSLFVFEAARTPALFLILPALTLASFRLRLFGVTLAVLIVALIAIVETSRGVGPIATQVGDPVAQQFYLAIFLFVLVTAKLPVAVILEERDKAMRQLVDSERKYRLLAQHSNDMILRIGLDGVYRFVSPACQSILGYMPDELVGQTPIADIHPDDRARINQVCRSLLEGAVNPVCAYRQRRRDGRYIWLEATYSLLRDDSGAPVETVASVRDIGRRRTDEIASTEAIAQLQENHRLLIMAETLAGIGHFRMDAITTTLFWSDEVFRIHGCPLGSPPSISDALNFYHPDDRAMVTALVDQILADGNPWTMRARLIRPDGVIRHVESSVQAERAPDGVIVGIFGIFRDITNEVSAAAELIAARDAANASAEAGSTFLATMSHEIRTPMTGVLGMIDLLRKDPPSIERERYFDNLQQSATLLMRILDDVLDFSKIESGHLQLESTGLDLGAICQATLDLFKPSAASKGLELRFEGAPGCDTWVRGDPVRLQQILSNLVSNAIKFSDSGVIAIVLQLTPVKDQRRVRIDVSDTGIGMKRDAIDAIFAPFVQADASITRRFGGTGLGLAITKKLVEAMGGTISIDSRLGAGTRITIDLVLDAAAPPAPKPRPIAREHRPPLSILLAEDNAINRTLIETLVHRLGDSIHSVENGRQAVEISKNRKFDVILMDLRMPDMDGLAAAHAIRAQAGPCQKTPIVALTADIVDARRDTYRLADFSDLLSKPVDPTALGDCLTRLANASSRQDREAGPTRQADGAIIDEAKFVRVWKALDETEFADILAMMRTELTIRPALIAEAVVEGRIADAISESHGFRGAMAGVGAARVAVLAGHVEKACAAGAPAEAIAARLVEDAGRTLAHLDRVAASLRAQS